LIRDHTGEEVDQPDNTSASQRCNPCMDGSEVSPRCFGTLRRHSLNDPAHAKEFRNNRPRISDSWINSGKNCRTRQTADDRRYRHHQPGPIWLTVGSTLATIRHSRAQKSALQIQSLVAKIKKDHIKIIVSEIQLSQRILNSWQKRQSPRDCPLLATRRTPDTETYLDMLRYNVLHWPRTGAT
jgi:zinc/manganese transport system substrate-binding protein/zinc transport system substrate-binding protein/manganese/iron transport system substrate-binding protein